MAVRPGGKRSVSATLDFTVQMKGISDIISNIIGLNSKIKEANKTVLDFNNSIRNVESVSQEMINSQMDIYEVHISSLSQAVDSLESYKSVMNNVAEVGNWAFGVLSSAVLGIKGMPKEVSTGFSIIGKAGKKAFSLMDTSIEESIKKGRSNIDKLVGLADSLGGTKKLSVEASVTEEGGDLKSAERQIVKLANKFASELSNRINKLLAGKGGVKEKGGVTSIKEGIGGFKKEKGSVELGSKGVPDIKKMASKSKMSKMPSLKDLKKLKDLAKGSSDVTGKLSKLSNGVSKVAGESIGLETNVASAAVEVGELGAGSVAAEGSMLALSEGMVATTVATGGLNIVIGVLVTVTLGALIATIELLVESFKMAVSTMEEYRLTNYRALGSIEELTEATFKLTATTGMSNEESIALIKSMSHAGITMQGLKMAYGDGQKAMDSLLESQGKFYRMTGISVDSINLLSKQLINSNVSLDDQDSILSSVSYSMHKYGLTAKDAGQIMNHMAKSLAVLNVSFRGNNELIKNYTNNMMSLARAAKQAGVGVSVVASIDEELRGLTGGTTALAVLSGEFDKFVNKGMGAKDATEILFKGFEKVHNIVDKMPAGLRIKTLKDLGLSDDQITTFSNMYNEMMRLERKYRQEKHMTAEAAHAAALQEMKSEKEKALQKEENNNRFTEATGTLGSAFSEMFSESFAVIGQSMMPLIKDLTKWFKDLKPSVVNISAGIGDAFSGIYNGLRGIIVVSMDVITIIMDIIGWIARIGGVMFKSLGLLMTPLNNIMVGISHALVDLFAWLDGHFTGFLDKVSKHIDDMIDKINYIMSWWSKDKEEKPEESNVGEKIKKVVPQRVIMPVVPVTVSGVTVEEAVSNELKKSRLEIGGAAIKATTSPAINTAPVVGRNVSNEMMNAHVASQLAQVSNRARLSQVLTSNADHLAQLSRSNVRIGELVGEMKSKSGAGTPVIIQEDKTESAGKYQQSSPVYSSLFEDKLNNDVAHGISYLSSIVELSIVQNELLAKLIDKDNPDSEKIVAVLEDIKNRLGGGSQIEVYRSRRGFGESASKWMFNGRG